MEEPWIEFDLEKVKQLKTDLENTMAFIQAELPIKLSARKEVLDFFETTFGVVMKTTTIKEMESITGRFDKEGDKYNNIMNIITHTRMKYTIRNYLTPILKKSIGSCYQLRYYFGEWVFQNKRPLPKSPEIVECITDYHELLNYLYECTNSGIIVRKNKEENTWLETQSTKR